MIENINKKLLLGTVLLFFAGCISKTSIVDEDTLARLHTKSYNRASQNTPSVPVDVYTAISYALKNNITHRVAKLNEILTKRELNLVGYELLPDFLVSSGYSARNSYPQTFTKYLNTGRKVYSNTALTDKTKRDDGVSIGWEAIDFGLAYLNAKQKGNEVLIARERKRQAMSQIVSEVYQAFWSALTAQNLENDFRQIEVDTNIAINDLNSKTAQINAPLESLNTQRQLILLKRNLSEVRYALEKRRYRLSELLSANPYSKIQLVGNFNTIYVPQISPEELDQLAFQNRPELRISVLEYRISVLQAKSEFVKLFPSVRLTAGWNHTTDSLNAVKNWSSIALKASWNLINLVKYPSTKKRNKALMEISKEKAVGVGIGVLTQNRLAELEYLESLRSYYDNLRVQNIELRVEQKVQNQASAAYATVTKIDVLRAYMNRTISELDSADAYSRLQSSVYMLMQSSGYDALPNSHYDQDISVYAQTIRQRMSSALKLAMIRPNDSLASINTPGIRDYLQNIQKIHNDNSRIEKSLPNTSSYSSYNSSLPVIRGNTKTNLTRPKNKVSFSTPDCDEQRFRLELRSGRPLSYACSQYGRSLGR